MGTSQKRIPQPVPDPNNLGRYMKPFESPTSRRFPDDWQPRVNIKKEFSNGNLLTETCIDRFATKFVVDPKLIKAYVQHLNYVKQRSQMRAAQTGRKSQQLKQKTFEEYEWRQLGLAGEISKLKVFKLDK